MADNRFKLATRRVLWIVAASGAAMGVAGCGDSDPASDAVERAALEINTLSLGGANPMPDVDLRVTAYRQIVSDLQPHASAETPETAAAANLLIARAHAGLAAVKFDELAAMEGASERLFESLRLQLDRYLTQQSQVSSLEAYDPASHLADLDAQIKTKDGEIEQAWSAKSALDAALATLEAQAAQASGRAAQERQQETALRQQAINATAVKQAELITKANEHKRAADAHDMEASQLRAEATQQAPEGVALQAEIDRLTDQRKLLEDAKAEIRAFAKSNSDRAAACRAEAMAAAEQIRQTADELAKLRAGIPEIAEASADAFDQAIRFAGAARQPGEIVEAVNRHAKADLLTLRVRGMRAYAAMLSALADAAPPLPGSDAYRSQAQKLMTDADEMAKEAMGLLEEAQTAYDNAASSGDAADRFQRLAASMERLTGKAANTPPVELEEVAEAPAEADASGGDPETEVRAMLTEFAAAAESGDNTTALGFLDLSDPTMRELVEASLELDAVCREKFGKSADEIAAESMGGDAGGGAMGMPPAEELAQVQVEIEGPDRVKLIPPSGSEEVSMRAVRVDGRWKLQMEFPPDAAPMIGAMAGVFKKVSADIRSGAIGTPEQLGPAMMQYLMPIMMEQMQRQQGGGG